MLGLRRVRSVAIISLTILCLVGPAVRPAAATTSTEQRFHRLINNARANGGLSRLRLSERLSATARAHSRQMAAGRRMFHHECLSCELRSYSWRIAGENVGAGDTARQIHRRMMRSRPHRRNILRPGYRRVGIGVARAGGLIYVTEIFLG